MIFLTLYFSFLLWKKFDVTLLEGGGNTLAGRGEVYCFRTLDSRIACFIVFHCIAFLQLAMNVSIGNSPTVNSNIEKGIFHSSSHILTWLHLSKRFLFSS